MQDKEPAKGAVEFQSEVMGIGSEVWSYGFEVPNAIADQFINDNERRVICHISGLKPFHCALLPTGENSWFILLNAERRKKASVAEGDILEVRLEKDESEYGMEMPESLGAVLDQDEVACTLFHDLTPGKMRNIIHYVAQVKSTDIRIRRALVIMDHLKRNQGKILYKELTAEMKEANRNAKRRFD